MNSLLTTIAGQFAKPLFLSAVLPVVIVLSLLLALVYPLFPVPLVLPDVVSRLDAQWQVAWATLAALIGSMLLYILNSPIARLFSGYPWKDTLAGSLLARRYRTRFDELTTARDALVNASAGVGDGDAAHTAARHALLVRLKPLETTLNADFPYDRDLILPTKLGNVIRNFEDYSRRQYGISAVPLWPRLLAVVDAKYASLLDDAKTSFDFAVNCLFLFCCAAAATLGLAWWHAASGALLVAALWRAALFVLLAALAYEAAVNRARDWGAYVKAAVDLYRTALLKQLGYQQSPTGVADERARIWPRIAEQWAFPDLCDTQQELPFVPPAVTVPAVAATSPAAGKLTFARGVSAPAGRPYASLTVTIEVRNADAKDATPLTVSDAVPANWVYEWGSAAVSAGSHVVRGSSPVTIEIDQLAAGQSVTLTYRLRSLVATP